jgi:membrane protein
VGVGVAAMGPPPPPDAGSVPDARRRGPASAAAAPQTDRRMSQPERTAGEVEDIGLEPAKADEADPRFFRRLFRRMMEHDISGEAAHVAFFAFLSFPPTIITVFAMTGLFGGPETAQWLTDQLQAVLPEEAWGVVEEFVGQVVGTPQPGLFSLGLVLALWAASNVFAALGRSLDLAYGIRSGRFFLKQRMVAIGVMLIFVVLFMAGSLTLIAGPAITRGLRTLGFLDHVWEIAQWPLAFVLVTTAFWTTYYVLPARSQRGEGRRILVGAVLAAALWMIASIGFRIYIENWGNYSETYGILGTMIVILMWMWISMLVVLFGGEVAAQLRPLEDRLRDPAVSS